jgi:DNA mismatch repair protein MutL
MKFTKREKLLRSMALQQSVKAGTSLSNKEMSNLLQDLFACEVPNSTPNGKPTYMTFKKDELDKMFGR